MKDYLKPYILKLTFLINSLFLVWHAMLLGIFFYERMWILVAFNVFSLCIYIRTMFALKVHQPHGVIRLMYVELLFHMLISVGTMGWDCGFQEYAFGILPVIMLGDYIEENGRFRISSVARVVSVALSYLALGIWTSVKEPIYTFPTEAGTRLFGIINGSVTVIAVSAYFLLFTRMVLGYERGLIHEASYDPLTGLANRRVLYDSENRLKQTEDVCVFMIDVDNFKSINDRYGHEAGDRVLKAVGELLMSNKYKMNEFLPIRWGGEEFVVIYADDALGRGEKIRQLDHIREQISELRVRTDEKEITFTVTVGASTAGEDKTIDGLIALADSRMYYGKNHGKNCLVFTHDEWRNNE